MIEHEDTLNKDQTKLIEREIVMSEDYVEASDESQEVERLKWFSQFQHHPNYFHAARTRTA